MKTWQNYAGYSGAATTTWNYNPYRGWLDNKRYADNTGQNYTNTAAGRLKTRVWARGISTTYTYNNAGDLSAIIYSDSTAGSPTAMIGAVARPASCKAQRRPASHTMMPGSS